MISCSYPGNSLHLLPVLEPWFPMSHTFIVYSLIYKRICSSGFLKKDSSVQFSCSVVSDSLRPHGLQHTRLPCLLPTPRAHSNSCPLSWRCHLTISPSVVLFSSCLQSFPASGSFPVSQFFMSGGQSIGVSVTCYCITKPWVLILIKNLPKGHN